MSKFDPKQKRAFLGKLLTDTACADWTLIGSVAYRRGPYGTFKLEAWCDGGHVTGVEGTYTPHSGGAPDRIVFEFADLLTVSKPSHPNWRDGMTPHVIKHCGWDWYMCPPDGLNPLHDAISDWLVMWDIREAELEAEIKSANRARKGR